MAASNPSRKTGSAWNVLVLVGCFMIFCAVVIFSVAGWRAYRAHLINTRWIEASAQVKKCSLGVYRPYAKNVRSRGFSLLCRLGYDFASGRHEYNLRTPSSDSERLRSEIEDWITQHPPGTTLAIRVNPSDAHEIAVKSELPGRQFSTARNALVTALISGGGGTFLIAIGRALATRRH